MGVSLCIYASDPIPINTVLFSDFSNAYSSEGALPDGWNSKGCDTKVTGPYKDYFKNYSSGNAYFLLQNEDVVAACSPSEFIGAMVSDQWLFTPEFVVTDDPMLITYKVSAIGNAVRNNFSIYISEAGSDRDDFYEIMGSSIKGKGNEVASEIRTFVLDGYKGEKVRLAFVNSGNTSGLMAFSDISVAPFYIALDNPDKYRNIIIDDDITGFTITGEIATPFPAKDMKVSLTTSAGYEYEYNYSGSMSATPSEMILRFPDVDMKGALSADYTITITPDYLGAVPVQIKGTINYGKRDYKGVLMLEELTGTWCGYCVYGIGSLDYLQKTYDGSEDSKGLAIGLAVHSGTSSSPDPMQVPGLVEITESKAKPLGFSGYPHMIINRAYGGHPAEVFSLCENIINKGSYAKVKISGIEYNDITREVRVKYDSFLTFDAEVANINALAYVTQNNMSGNGKDWFQSNNLCNYTTEQMIKEVGPTIAPYYSEYINGAPGLLKIDFDDVVRCVYPSYNGEHVDGEWIKDSAKKCELAFTLPDDVTDWKNSEISIFLTNSNTGEVIAGDRMGASDYEVTAVDEVAADGITLNVSGSIITVNVPEAGNMEIYTADGRKVVSSRISEGFNSFETRVNDGLLIVKVNCGNNTKAFKVLTF
ncbi:MAG: T9SS type A sorting domain-containing protein [Lachnospiraceae bacterium]|nr:T9SS type A sorting domain-containing protein [Lachnospiraceae bacterium]